MQCRATSTQLYIEQPILAQMLLRRIGFDSHATPRADAAPGWPSEEWTLTFALVLVLTLMVRFQEVWTHLFLDGGRQSNPGTTLTLSLTLTLALALTLALDQIHYLPDAPLPSPPPSLGSCSTCMLSPLQRLNCSRL